MVDGRTDGLNRLPSSAWGELPCAPVYRRPVRPPPAAPRPVPPPGPRAPGRAA